MWLTCGLSLLQPLRHHQISERCLARDGASPVTPPAALLSSAAELLLESFEQLPRITMSSLALDFKTALDGDWNEQ